MLLSSQLYSQQKAENFVFLSISSLFLTIRTNCTATLSKYGCDQHHGQKLNFVYREISKENVLCVCVWKNAMLSKVNSFKNAPFALNGPQFTVCFICRYISMRSKHFFSRVQAQTELFFMQMEYIYFCCCTLLVRLLLIVLSQGFRVHLELVVLCVCVCFFHVHMIFVTLAQGSYKFNVTQQMATHHHSDSTSLLKIWFWAEQWWISVDVFVCMW